MREIRFRGRKLYDGKWAESVCPVGIMISGKLVYDFDPATVGQYTGLKDKNGKRIFEGDIVRERGIEEFLQYVVYNEAKFELKEHGLSYGSLISSGDQLEIIGNIHDHQELLEGGPNNGR